jgi:ComF family protein
VFEDYERYFCIPCYSNMPLFPFKIEGNTPVVKAFWGRYMIEKGGAFLIYKSGSTYSQIFKEIKYRDKPDLAFYLGYVYGIKLKREALDLWNDIDLLLPVPLSKSKQRARGYNQADMIADGMSKALGIPVDKSSLMRTRSRGSQTSVRRFERWLNVRSNYVCNGFSSQIQHVAIIDDVLTTGATIGACIESILIENKVKISVFCLGYTHS